MKKFIFLLFTLLFSVTIFAQTSRQVSNSGNQPVKILPATEQLQVDPLVTRDGTVIPPRPEDEPGGPTRATYLALQNFDATAFPPTGWTRTALTGAPQWSRTTEANLSTPFTPALGATNTASATHAYDATPTRPNDEWLISPTFSAATATTAHVIFWVGYSGPWMPGGAEQPGDGGADVQMMVSIDNGANYTKVWSYAETHNGDEAWKWEKYFINIQSLVAGQTQVKIAIRYVGRDGDLAGFDNVSVEDFTMPPTELTLSVVPATLNNLYVQGKAKPLAHARFDFAAAVKNLGAPNAPAQLTATITTPPYSATATVPPVGYLQTEEVILPTSFNPTALGQYTVNFSVPKYGGTGTEMVTASKQFEATQNIFINDNGNFAGYGIGSSGAAGSITGNYICAGQLHYIAQTEVVDKIQVSFSSASAAQISLGIYSVNLSTGAITNVYTTAPMRKDMVTADQLYTFKFTPQTLASGWYLFAVSQIGPDNMGLSYTGAAANPLREDSYFYGIGYTTGGLSYYSGYGAVAVRVMTQGDPTLTKIATFPFLESFEDNSLTRYLWSQYTDAPYSHGKQWTYGAGSGTSPINVAQHGALSVRSTTGGTAANNQKTKLVTPILNLTSVATPELSFYYANQVNGSNQNYLTVYYRTSVTGAWTQLAQYTTSITAWTKVTLPLPNKSAEYQIAFEAWDRNGRPIAIDNIRIGDPVGCEGIAGIPATPITNIYHNSATVTWTAATPVPSNGYDVYWTTSTAQPLPTVTPNVNTTALTTPMAGLTSSTTYYVWVRTNCGGTDYGDWMLLANFKTLCTPITLPIYENFSATQPDCWQNFRTAGAGVPGTWDFVSSGTYEYSSALQPMSPFSGTHMARYNCYGYASGTRANLVTPILNNISNTTAVKFMMFRDNGYLTTADLINVYASNTNATTGASLLTTVNRSISRAPAITPTTAVGWYEYYAMVPTGTFQYIIFDGNSAYGNSMYLNNIEVFNPNTITLTTRNIGGTAGQGGVINIPNVYPSIRDGYYPAVPGSSKTFTFTADAGYVIDSVYVDGVYNAAATTAASHTFSNITAPHSILVTFTKTWTITASVVGTPPNGTINPTGTITYKCYATPTYSSTPNTGYHVKEVKVGSTIVVEGNPDLTEVLPYTFNLGLTANVNLTVEFAQNTTYILTFDANGGTVTPAQKDVISDTQIGALPTPTRPGYTFVEWRIDGAVIATTTVWNYGSNKTAVAQWTANPYTLTLDPTTGTLPGAPPYTMPVTFDAAIGALPTPTQTDCVFVEWRIDGVPINVATVWTYPSNKTAIAIWDYPVLVTVTGPGEVNPDGNVYYRKDATPTYTFIPDDPGAHIVSVIVDGENVYDEYDPEVTADFEYIFAPMVKARYVTATFATNFYAMNPDNDIPDGATIKMYAGAGTTPATTITHGETVTFKITFNCYEYKVYIDGALFGTFNNAPGVNNQECVYVMTVEGPLPKIEVKPVKILTYTVTATPSTGVDPMGNIAPAGITTKNCGSSQTYYFYPAEDHRVKTVYVDGIPVPNSASMRNYTINDILKNYTIHVEFEPYPTYIIQFGPDASIGAGGQVYLEGYLDEYLYYVKVDSADNATFVIEAFEGFEIDKVYVDNVVIPNANNTEFTYEFAHVKADHIIYATFKPIMFTITPVVVGNGIITPANVQQVPYGATPTFQAVPDFGYQLKHIIIDDEDIFEDGDVYQFDPVMANHTITAVFEKITYIITATHGDNGAYGTISPAGAIKVKYGEDKTFTFLPKTGYEIAQVLVNGAPNPVAVANGYYTFTNVSQNNTIDVTFTRIMFTITSTCTAGGFITPWGVNTVGYGANSAIYVFAAQDGFQLKSVLIDGEINYDAWEEGMYRFLDVQANHTIHAIFEPKPFTIVATTTAGGTINPSGMVTVLGGENKTFYFAAFEGYELDRVLIDGGNDSLAVANGYYTFTNIIDHHTIRAFFEPITYKVSLPNDPGATVAPVVGYITTVKHGSMFKFTVTLLEGYTKSTPTVRVNGIIVAPDKDGIYTINNITANQVVTIDGVTPNLYRIIPRAHAGGTMDPSEIFMAPYNSEQLFTFFPNKNYEVDKVLVNGAPEAVTGNTFTLKSIKADQTVDVYFKYVPPTIGIPENDEAIISVFSHNNVVTIMNEALVPVKLIEIMDMYGRVVWTGKTTGDKTEISLHVATGIYGVRIITEANTISTTKVSIQ